MISFSSKSILSYLDKILLKRHRGKGTIAQTRHILTLSMSVWTFLASAVIENEMYASLAFYMSLSALVIHGKVKKVINGHQVCVLLLKYIRKECTLEIHKVLYIHSAKQAVKIHTNNS